MQSIPKLDLSHFTHGSDSQKHHFVNELGYAYEHIGFVAIRNHGIPNEVLTDLYREVKNFFDLSERVKMQYDDSMGGGQRAIQVSVKNMPRTGMRVISKNFGILVSTRRELQ